MKILFTEMGCAKENGVNVRIRAQTVTRDNSNVFIEISAGVRPDRRYYKDMKEYEEKFPYESCIYLDSFFNVLDKEEKDMVEQKRYSAFEYTEQSLLKFLQLLLGDHITGIEFCEKSSC